MDGRLPPAQPLVPSFGCQPPKRRGTSRRRAGGIHSAGKQVSGRVFQAGLASKQTGTGQPHTPHQTSTQGRANPPVPPATSSANPGRPKGLRAKTSTHPRSASKRAWFGGPCLPHRPCFPTCSAPTQPWDPQFASNSVSKPGQNVHRTANLEYLMPRVVVDPGPCSGGPASIRFDEIRLVLPHAGANGCPCRGKVSRGSYRP